MKTRKLRKLLLTLCSALLLVSLSVGMTVAYLTSQDSVTNTFTVGQVKIKLDEAKVNADGKPVVVGKDAAGNQTLTPVDKLDEATRVEENDYKLYPGKKYTKDPTVTVLAGSDESYIRLLVTINNIANVKAALGDDFLPEEYVDWANESWASVKSTPDTASNSITYEFRYVGEGTTNGVYKAVTTDTKLPALFTTIEMPNTLDNTAIAKLANTEVKVVAQAIQADGFGTADLAWAEWPESSTDDDTATTNE